MVRSAVSAPARDGALAERRSDVLESRLSVLRAALEQQRDFRREQLAHADVRRPTHGSPVTDDSTDRGAGQAVREVEALVAAGARRALADIEVALDRMRPAATATAAYAVRTSPLSCSMRFHTTTVCLACQQSTDRSTVEGGRGRDGRVSARGPARRDLHIGGGDVEQARYQFCGGSLAGNDSRPQSSTMSLSRRKSPRRRPDQDHSTALAAPGTGRWSRRQRVDVSQALDSPIRAGCAGREHVVVPQGEQASDLANQVGNVPMGRSDVLGCKSKDHRLGRGGVRLPREQSASSGRPHTDDHDHPALAVRG